MFHCFACGKKFGKSGARFLADTRDEQEVFVGPECFKHIQSAGDVGYQPPKGGPRLWPLSAAGVLADMERCAGELPGEESEILHQARAGVEELMEAMQAIKATVELSGSQIKPLSALHTRHVYETAIAALNRCSH